MAVNLWFQAVGRRVVFFGQTVAFRPIAFWRQVFDGEAGMFAGGSACLWCASMFGARNGSFLRHVCDEQRLAQERLEGTDCQSTELT